MRTINSFAKKGFSGSLFLLLCVGFFSNVYADKSKQDEFNGTLVLSADSKDFIKHLQNAKKSGKLSVPKSVTETTKGKETFVFILFSGCKADSKTKKCNALVNVKVLDPKKKTFFNTNLVLWRGKPLAKGNLKLSAAQLGIIVEKKDPKGKYEVIATLVDKVANKTVKLTKPLTVK